MLQKALVLVFVLAGIAGCMGCGTTSHFVYATVPDANQVVAYREDPYSGTLTELSGSPYTVGDGANFLVIHPSGKFMYVANPGQNENTISLLNIASNGTLSVGASTSVAPASLPKVLAMDQAGKYLYVANAGSNDISVFSIDAGSGQLTPVAGSPFFINFPPLNIQLTPSGKYLYVSGVSDENGEIEGYSLNAGVIQTQPPVARTSSNGLSPNGLAVDPGGTYLYVANTGSNSISIFKIASTGALTEVQGSPLGDSYNDPVSLTVDPTGKYLYVANQGSNNVSVYSTSSSGLPVALTTSTSTYAFSTETTPTVLSVDPNGGYLFVGNQGSSAGIQAFGIFSGNLNPLLTYGVASTPSSIAVLQ
ncbi:MAG: beta-propeller fold lactonase family protein [Candidatus Sulfotelmatobacter sp.]